MPLPIFNPDPKKEAGNWTTDSTDFTDGFRSDGFNPCHPCNPWSIFLPQERAPLAEILAEMRSFLKV
jgi:hypothetical protein